VHFVIQLPFGLKSAGATYQWGYTMVSTFTT
jgi:hypothetical protein